MRGEPDGLIDAGVLYKRKLMAEPFAALADPRRRAVLDRLRGGPLCVSDLVGGSGVSQPAISQHLARLRDAGLVRAERRGRRTFYHLDAAPLAEVDAWLDAYRRFWTGRLDALGRHLCEET